MMSRHLQALAGIGLAVAGTLAVPSIASAQYNRVPDPNAARMLVAVFKASEKGLGVQAADAVRSRMNSEFPFKQVYVLPKTDINATLEASGFPIADALEAHDQRALATLLRADEYVTGTVTKTATGVKVEANLVLARDNALVQPIGSYDVKSVGDAAGAISKELKEARKQLDAEKKCINSAREHDGATRCGIRWFRRFWRRYRRTWTGLFGAGEYSGWWCGLGKMGCRLGPTRMLGTRWVGMLGTWRRDSGWFGTG